MRDGRVLGTSLWVVPARKECPFVVPFCSPSVYVCVCLCMCVFNLAELRNVVQRLYTWEFQDKQLWTDLVTRKRSGHF